MFAGTFFALGKFFGFAIAPNTLPGTIGALGMLIAGLF